MSGIDWFEEPIHKKHDRDSFDCGDDALNEFLRRHARKSHEMGGSKTFLAMDSQDRKGILGFYSLTPASLEYARTLVRTIWGHSPFRFTVNVGAAFTYRLRGAESSRVRFEYVSPIKLAFLIQQIACPPPSRLVLKLPTAGL